MHPSDYHRVKPVCRSQSSTSTYNSDARRVSLSRAWYPRLQIFDDRAYIFFFCLKIEICVTNFTSPIIFYLKIPENYAVTWTTPPPKRDHPIIFFTSQQAPIVRPIIIELFFPRNCEKNSWTMKNQWKNKEAFLPVIVKYLSAIKYGNTISRSAGKSRYAVVLRLWYWKWQRRLHHTLPRNTAWIF